ncbi:MAG TPA: sulfite exporter TauE/SafE family protein [Candidatus Acidoferrales bacterium]|nr:sulfite exporter TauE/SafE family protein [Candidatus Acidoferrales bacterium]
MNDLGFLLGGMAIGFLGSTHCVAMCGGFAGALSLTVPPRRQTWERLLLVHLCTSSGRVASYTVAGALVGTLGSWMIGIGGSYGGLLLRLAAGTLLLLLGLYLAGWSTALARLEAVGGRVWRRVNSVVGRQRPRDPFVAALLFGALWGWLPCGLVYTSLGLAATTGRTAGGALVMVGFGFGTVPMMLLTGVVTGRIPTLMRRPASRRVAGAFMIAFGVWTIVGPLLLHHAHGESSVGCTTHIDDAMPARQTEHGSRVTDRGQTEPM